MENMKIRYFQRGFNYSQDGPGNRLVYHLQGCNMHCPWCSNPEGMDMFSNSKEIESEELVKEVLSCKPMMFEGGGVTFTGGEATLQIKQLVPVFKKLRENGVTIAIETNGTVCDLSKYAELCDYWMIDFKSPLKEKLEKVTGVSYDILKQNILNLGNRLQVHIRIPLIHGFNDDDLSLQDFLAFFAKLKEDNKRFDVEILPYHEYGKEKWIKCGKKYRVVDGFVPEKRIKLFVDLLEKNGIEIIHT